MVIQKVIYVKNMILYHGSNVEGAIPAKTDNEDYDNRRF